MKDRANSTRQALDDSEKAIKKAAEALNVAQANLNGTRDATAQVDHYSLRRIANVFAKFTLPGPSPWPTGGRAADAAGGQADGCHDAARQPLGRGGGSEEQDGAQPAHG